MKIHTLSIGEKIMSVRSKNSRRKVVTLYISTRVTFTRHVTYVHLFKNVNNQLSFFKNANKQLSLFKNVNNQPTLFKNVNEQLSNLG